MSNDKSNEFAGEHLSAWVARKQIIILGDTNRQPPSVGIFDSPTRCFVVNQEWWSLIAGMVHWLADVAAWPDAESDEYFAIKEILRFMQGVECMDFALRQNPENDCILQQTLDGGDTWTDVFDFSLCTTIQDKSYEVVNQNNYSYAFENIFQNTYNEFTTNYVSSPVDVHAELDYDTGDVDALDAAYCNAVYTLVSACCDAAIQYYRDQDEEQQSINVGLAIGAIILTGIALAGALPTAGASLAGLGALASAWASVIGLTAPLGNALVDHWQTVSINQFQDESAIEEVVCFIVDELPGDENTLAAMQAVLDGHGMTGNAAAIADTLNLMLDHDSTYAAFLEKWTNNLEYAEAGIELYCPCVDTWCKFYDFRAEEYEFIPAPGAPSAVWNSGSGWQCEFENLSGFGNRVVIRRDLASTITSDNIKMRYIATVTSSARIVVGNGATTVFDSGDLTLLGDGVQHDFAAIATTLTWDNITIIGLDQVNFSTLDTDAVTITELEISGSTGDAPPEGDVC